MKPSPRPRHAGWSSETTHPSAAVGSIWLSPNSVSCPLNVDRRIPDKQTLTDEVDAWQNRRNTNHATADWQFTPADARVKLKRLYPTLRVTQGTTLAHLP